MATEQIVPLTTQQPSIVELADAVRQLQRLVVGVESGEEFDPTEILERLTTLESSVTTLSGTVNNLVEFQESLENPVITGGFGSDQQWAMNFAGLKFKGGLIPVPENQVKSVTFTTAYPVRSLFLLAVPITSQTLGGIPIGYFRETDYFTRTGFKLDNNRDSNWWWISGGI